MSEHEKNYSRVKSVESWNLHLMPSLFSESQQTKAFVEVNELRA